MDVNDCPSCGRDHSGLAVVSSAGKTYYVCPVTRNDVDLPLAEAGVEVAPSAAMGWRSLKFEVTISEEEIQKLLQRAVRKVIADEGFGLRATIEPLVREALHRVVKKTVDEAMTDLYRKKIEESIASNVTYVLQEVIRTKLNAGR